MSSVRKRSVAIRGHRTSYSVEDEFETELRRIASDQNKPLASLIAAIDEDRRPDTNLSSAIRLFVLRQLKDR